MSDSRKNEFISDGIQIARKTVKYSLCTTSYNAIETIRKSIDSLLTQLSDGCELVVVDNASTDGTLDVLKELEAEGKLRLIIQKCTRGQGRQLAFQNASGEYIIDQIDLDDFYWPILNDIIQIYHQKFEGMFLLCRAFLIAPRKIIQDLGGWRNLQWGEDRDLWIRAAAAGKLIFLPIETRSYIKPHGYSKSTWRRVKYQYERARDCYRIGMNPITEHSSITNSIVIRFLAALGYVRSRFMERYGEVKPELNQNNFVPSQLFGKKEVTLDEVKALSTLG
ncbi:MAG: glycosyltransferase [Nitrososphaerota archaeon]|nr:glycosyltransferase [Nitrososphaerota archaeon]